MVTRFNLSPIKANIPAVQSTPSITISNGTVTVRILRKESASTMMINKRLRGRMVFTSLRISFDASKTCLDCPAKAIRRGNSGSSSRFLRWSKVMVWSSNPVFWEELGFASGVPLFIEMELGNKDFSEIQAGCFRRCKKPSPIPG